MKTDFLVIGSGLAGLNYALLTAERFPDKHIVIVTKGRLEDSNTKFAQGGIAIVMDENDSFEKHIEDTLVAGDGLCNPEIVRMVVNSAPECYENLSKRGVLFDKNQNGNIKLGLEGGHSKNRIVHHKDKTGQAIENTLINKLRLKPNIHVFEKHFALELISSTKFKNTCIGAHVLNCRTNTFFSIYSEITVLATGGIGQVYQHTTNSLVATGDGIALAHQMNAIIEDMEFIQFHPTTLFSDTEDQAFLISEAVRGAGAKLTDESGHPFMKHFDDRADLACRDIVSRAIDSEMKIKRLKHVFLDASTIEREELLRHFPTIINKCHSKGIDPMKDLIPVVPAQHYLCGGILTNSWGESSVNRLLVCGESAKTGLHGANRLASNSLLEAYVFSKRCFEKSMELIQTSIDENPANPIEREIIIGRDVFIDSRKNQLRELMWTSVGIVRNDSGLLEALHALNLLESEIKQHFTESMISQPLCELRNMLVTARLIVRQSINRKENRGGFYNEDLVSDLSESTNKMHGNIPV